MTKKKKKPEKPDSWNITQTFLSCRGQRRLGLDCFESKKKVKN